MATPLVQSLYFDKSEFANLPRWARVAFAVRCAQRVHPLMSVLWPEMLESDAKIVEAAIGDASNAATRGEPLTRGAELEAGRVRNLATMLATKRSIPKTQ